MQDHHMAKSHTQFLQGDFLTLYSNLYPGLQSGYVK
jgi:hypothetical protein